MGKNIKASGHGYSYWIDFLTKNVFADKDGIYLVFCMDDAGHAYQLYKLKEGDNFYNVFGTCDMGQWVSELIAYKPIPEFSLENRHWIKPERESCSPFINMPFSGVYVVAYKTKDSKEVKYMLSAGSKGDFLIHEWMEYPHPTEYAMKLGISNVFKSLFLEKNPGFEILGYYYTFTFSRERIEKHYDLLKEDLRLHEVKVADERLLDYTFFALW